MSVENKVPAIRFEEFDREWASSKLVNLLDITSAARVHKNEWTDAGVPFFRTSDVVSIYKGIENKKAYISFELYKELSDRTGPVKKDDLLITGGGSIGIPYLITTSDPMYFKDADLLWLKNNTGTNGYFLFTFFSSPHFRKYINSITHIGTISHYTIEQAKSTPIHISEESEEQTKIGKYFQQLDTLIAQHQKKQDKLLNLKKALLEKMFPKQGATVPEIRFKGFSGEWVESSLGKLCKETCGGGTPRTSISEYWDGDIPWIQSSDLSEGQVVSVEAKKRISESGLKNSATKLIPEESIAIVTRVGVGKISLMQKGYATSQDFLSLSKLKVDPFYGVYSIWKMLQTEKLGVQGTSIKGITKEELLSKVIPVPIREIEQTKVGNLFKQLDTLINQHQTQLKKLGNIKQACLEKMFV